MGLESPDEIVPQNNADFGIVRDTYFIGGWRVVADSTARDAILAAKRVEGMRVRTRNDGKEWVLASNLTSWTEATTGGGSGIPDPSGLAGTALFSDGSSTPVWRSIRATDIVAAFAITGFSGSTNTREIGQSLTTPAFTASYNRSPSSAVLTDTEGTAPNDVHASPTAFSSAGTFTKTANNATVTFTLTAASSPDPSQVANFGVTWLPKIFFGVGIDQGSAVESFIEALPSSALASSRARSFAITVGAGQHGYFAAPDSYGTPTFTVGGFAGGFQLVGTTTVTNGFGVAQTYYLYKTTNSNLGTVSVVVS